MLTNSVLLRMVSVSVTVCMRNVDTAGGNLASINKLNPLKFDITR